MKSMFKIAVLAFSIIGAPAYAAEDAAPKKTLTSQQQKMVDCNAEAKARGLKGDERKVHMKQCLSSGQAASAEKAALKAETADAGGKKVRSEKQLAQAERMKACNAQARAQELKGEARKAHMKSCLSAA
jgi:hypothetical protein